MKEDKLSDLSMQLSVDVLRLTKELKAKHETVISNQLTEVQQVFVPILQKVNMDTAVQILLLNLKLH